jgi:hypothetical protein
LARAVKTFSTSGETLTLVKKRANQPGGAM